MLWNRSFLFVHIPKTAGKSLNRAFADALERPITCLIPRGQFQTLADCDQDGLYIREGRGHEALRKAATILEQEEGRSLAHLDAIFVAIRNPYDLMVSNYFYMRETYKHNKDRPNFQIANKYPFEEYAVRVGFAPVERWLTLDGEVPPNLRILRFENLQNDFNRYAEEFGFRRLELPRLNASERNHFTGYITARAEQAIYEKFRFLFDNGYYKRLSGHALKSGAQ